MTTNTARRPPAAAAPTARCGSHLAHQWRAFAEAAIRDQSYPAAPHHLRTCQLRLTRPGTPRLADPAFCALACTCQPCTDRLDRLFARALAAIVA